MSNFIKSRIFIMLLLLLFAFTVYKFFVNYQHINELKKRIDSLENAVTIAEEDKTCLLYTSPSPRDRS